MEGSVEVITEHLECGLKHDEAQYRRPILCPVERRDIYRRYADFL